MFEIQFVAPVAVCYTSAQAHPRLIFCDRHKVASVAELHDFFQGAFNTPPVTSVTINSASAAIWQQHRGFSDLMLGPRFDANGQQVFCQLEQPAVEFYFTTTGKGHLWKAWTTGNGMLPVGLSAFNASRGGGFADPSQPGFGLKAEESAWLHPMPKDPYLPIFATDRTTLDHWQNQALPFRIRQTQQPTTNGTSS